MARTIITVGEQLNKLPEEQKPGKVLVLTLTDGFENASKETTHQRLKEMIEHQKTKYSWDFVFLGSEPRAVSDATTLGTQSISYTGGKLGTQSVMSGVCRSVCSYRISGKYQQNTDGNK
jgi:hypothetical protein